MAAAQQLLMSYKAAGVTPVYLGSAKGGSSITGFDSTGATLLVVLATSFSGGTPSTGDVTDNRSNTYTLATTNSSVDKSAIYYCIAPTTSASLDITYSFGAAPSIIVIAFNGATFSLNSTNNASSTNRPGSTTGKLIVAMESNNVSPQSGVTVDSGFTIAQQYDYANGVHYGTTAAYLIQASAAQNPIFTSGGTDYSASAAAFDAS